MVMDRPVMIKATGHGYRQRLQATGRPEGNGLWVDRFVRIEPPRLLSIPTVTVTVTVTVTLSACSPVLKLQDARVSLVSAGIEC